jgi:hypothetical protein
VGRMGTGTLNFQGGLAKGGYTVVAKYGTAVWNHTGGVYDQNFGDFEIGDGGRPDQIEPGPRIGTINLSGGVIQGAGFFAIGNRRGTGIVNISGGALAINNVADGAIIVGRGLDSGDIVGQGGPTSLRVTGDDAIIIANGNFDMNSSGVAVSSTLIAEITGPTHTTIKVGGDALLANGTLAVDLTGYVPNVGDSWTILQAGVNILDSPEIAQVDALVAASLDPSLQHTLVHTAQAFEGTLQGPFKSIDYSHAVLPAGRGWSISYANNAVMLSVVSTGPAFSADFNNDGKVDGADLTKWKQSFGGAGADANGDGTSNGGRACRAGCGRCSGARVDGAGWLGRCCDCYGMASIALARRDYVLITEAEFASEFGTPSGAIGAAAADSLFSCQTGSRTVNAVPLPTVLSTRSRP